MPTFDSIAFSRDLVGRLVACSDSKSSSSSTAVAATATATTTAPIETPQSLLSRPPESIRLLCTRDDGTQVAQVIDPHATHQVRNDVALAMWKLTNAGKRQAILQSVLQKYQEEEDDEEQQETLLGPPGIQKASTTRSPVLFSNTISTLQCLQYRNIMLRGQKRSRQQMKEQQQPAATIHIISTGSIALDGMLAIPENISSTLSASMNTLMTSHSQQPDGVPCGYVFQCSGPSASGKTQLALQLAMSAAASLHNVWYLTSGVGTTPRPLAMRLKQLAFAAVEGHRSQALALLENISLQTIHNGYQLLARLDELEEMLLLDQARHSNSTTTTTTNSSSPPKALILDSASGCLTTEDDGLLQTVALRLKQLARNFELLVWINNGSVTPITSNSNSNSNSNSTASRGTAITSKPKPALGMAWKRACDIHISLQVPSHKKQQEEPYYQEQSGPSSTVVQATLEQHPFRNCHSANASSAQFCITPRGVQDHEGVE